MTTQNHQTRSRSAIGATLLSASAVAFTCFLVGCPPTLGGIVGLTGSCAALAQEAADIAQEGFGNVGDTSFLCRGLANQIATIDAGCFDLIPNVGGLDLAESRAAAVEGQQQFGCN